MWLNPQALEWFGAGLHGYAPNTQKQSIYLVYEFSSPSICLNHRYFGISPRIFLPAIFLVNAWTNNRVGNEYLVSSE